MMTTFENWLAQQGPAETVTLRAAWDAAIEAMRAELEEAKRIVSEQDSELREWMRTGAAQAATIEKLREALEMIVPYRAYNGDDWPANIAAQALAATQDDAAILRSHASDIDVANRIEEIALALDGYFSYERGLDPYIDELNKLAAKIRNGETDAT